MTALEALQKFWGYPGFRGPQAEIIASVMSGQDSLAILPTGGGKSICYQVPAVCAEGLCLVVSPLIALMQDQVSQLEERGIPAAAIFAGMDYRTMDRVLQEAVNNRLKLLYLSPERLQSNEFRSFLQHMDISLLAVDEAHCISQWGYDFRPSYLEIAGIREWLGRAPVLALTATATPAVQKDITEKLMMPGAMIFRNSFLRPELSYSVKQVQSVGHSVCEILNKIEGSAIVYCKSRKQTVEIAGLLRLAGIEASFYHAGLDHAVRKHRQEAWVQGKTRVMVSTNAFGMGIDKPDVRIVLHCGPPDCLENYYQEAGRAGRDGKRSYAVLLTQAGDIEDLKHQPAIRFQEPSVIRKIYGQLCNFLQAAEGQDGQQRYDFSFDTFVARFRLPVREALYSLQALRQDGVIGMEEASFAPSTVEFLIGRETLHQLESQHRPLDPLVKALLRSYGGIFDQPVAVSERRLAALLGYSGQTVQEQLVLLHQMRVLRYLPRAEKPQIWFIGSRPKVADLRAGGPDYQFRKSAYISRMQQMVAYLETGICRSVSLGRYFGDQDIKACGHCDNCRAGKKAKSGRVEFEALMDALLKGLNAGPVDADTLVKGIHSPDQAAPWEVLSYLQREGIVMVDTSGRICLK